MLFAGRWLWPLCRAISPKDQGTPSASVSALSKLLLSSAAVPPILFGEVPVAMEDCIMEAVSLGKGLPACAKELPRLQLPLLADLANGPGEMTLYYMLYC